MPFFATASSTCKTSSDTLLIEEGQGDLTRGGGETHPSWPFRITLDLGEHQFANLVLRLWHHLWSLRTQKIHRPGTKPHTFTNSTRVITIKQRSGVTLARIAKTFKQNDWAVFVSSDNVPFSSLTPEEKKCNSVEVSKPKTRLPNPQKPRVNCEMSPQATVGTTIENHRHGSANHQKRKKKTDGVEARSFQTFQSKG